MPDRSTVRRAIDRLLAAVFVASLCAPALAWMVGGDRAGLAGEEKRRPAAFPVVSWTGAGLGGFPREFEAYFDDHFGFRPQLVRWNNRLKAALGVSGVARVLIGRDGWLFLNEDDRIVEQFRGQRRFQPAELARWGDVLRERREWLAARRVPYVFLVAPDKPAIYPEPMPAALTRINPDTPLDQFAAYVRRTEAVRLVDPRAALRGAREAVPVYHKTDTHWNDLGAYIAYRELLEALARSTDLALRPRPLEDFDLIHEPGPGGDLAEILRLADVYREERVILRPRTPRRARRIPAPFEAGRRPVVVMETGDIRLPRAVVFRDSFADALLPFLSEDFERITYVWQPDFDGGIIEAERPDVVIHEMVERLLIAPPANVLPQRAGAPSAGAVHGR